MDIVNEECNYFYEDSGTISRSLHHDESEDEDDRQELEALLYSQLHYDDSKINISSIEERSPAEIRSDILASTKHVLMKPGPALASKYYKSQGFRVSHPSPFNDPARTQASRYYDIHQVSKNTDSVFITPQKPSEKVNENNKVSQLSAWFQPNNDSEKRTPHPAASTVASKFDLNRSKKKLNSKRGSEGILTGANLDHVQPGPTESKKSSPGDTSGTEHGKSEDISLPISSENVSCGSEIVTIETKLSDIAKKKSKNCEQIVSPSSMKKQHCFDAKVSEVLSSMLEEESRSSLEEHQYASISASQDPNKFNSESVCMGGMKPWAGSQPVSVPAGSQVSPSSSPDPPELSGPIASMSGWCVGMSWADMSSKSKFSFEVDSIEEESVSSLKLHDTTPAESLRGTPDLQIRSEVSKSVEEEESRYHLRLKNTQMGKKKVKHGESDSESEVGSVVEVAPPIKPTPLLVDISDAEYIPVKKVKKAKTSKNFIEEIFSNIKTKQEINRIDSAIVIESSSDDDIVIIEPPLSSPIISTSPRRPLKRSFFDEGNSSKDETPKKQPFHSKESRCLQEEDIANEERHLLERGRVLLNKPILAHSLQSKMEKLDQWLYNPIKATKHMGHEHLLKKMSAHPNLWQLCPADKNQLKVSPHGPKCDNCNQFGHRRKFCPAPIKPVVCHMCGNEGHPETRCPLKMCLRCGTKNGLYTDQCNSCSFIVALCKICQSQDHVWQHCPDLWRRYHLTTSSGDIVKPAAEDERPKHEHWCSNCAGNGHLSHECQRAQWKCQSIFPYVKSYATAVEEEQKLEQVTTVSMFLNDQPVALLSSPRGQGFLKTLSQVHCVSIKMNFEADYKSLTMEGVKLKLDKVRESVRNWIQQQENSASAAHRSKLASMSCKPWDLPPSVAIDRDHLVDVLTRQLKLIETPINFHLSVREIFEKLQGAAEESNDVLKSREHYNRMLNLILLGKCGFREGRSHISRLKLLLRKLRNKKVITSGKMLNSKISKHFLPVFSGKSRNDYEELVEMFYSDKQLVKAFDPPHRKSLVPVVEKEYDSNKLSEEPKKDYGLHHSGTDVNVQMQTLRSDSAVKKVKLNVKKLMVLESKMHRVVPVILENLSARSIFCPYQEDLQSTYTKFCNCRHEMEPAEIGKCLKRLSDLTAKLCKIFKLVVLS